MNLRKRTFGFLLSLVSLAPMGVLAQPPRGVGTRETPRETTVELQRKGPPEGQSAKSLRGAEIKSTAGYPELHVDGEPFFIHGATFFYYRLPRDLWEPSLKAHRDLGINTIVLPIPWNWHEVREGEFDFEGAGNPRRDLRALLRLVAELGFKLIARPVAGADREWKNSGFPESSAEAGGGALESAESRWLAAVARVLAPFSAANSLTVPDDPQKKGVKREKQISGPLILVSAGPAGRAEANRRALAAGGLTAVPFFAEREGAHEPVEVGGNGRHSGSPPPPAAGTLGIVGRWFPREVAPHADAATDTPTPSPRRFDALDAARLSREAQALQTQSALPPLFLEFQAGWAAPAEDVRPPEISPSDTLLISRLLLAHGAAGLGYFPLQDTLAPAGWDGASGNRYYRWDAALDINAERQPRARPVLRNGQLVDTWGPFLAAAHPRADFGVIFPRAADATAARRFEQLERLAALAALSLEAVDPETQPVEHLLRHGVILALSPGSGAALSEHAHANLAEYARRGGRTVDVSEELFSWVKLEESLAATQSNPRAAAAGEALRAFLRDAGYRPAVTRGPTSPGALLIRQVVTNAGSAPLSDRTRESGPGLLSVTNLGDDTVEEDLEILSPRVSARAVGSGLLPLRVSVPPGDSMMLPLHAPLCSAARPGHECTDEVIVAGAELLWAERDGKELQLTMYVPTRATLRLKLERQPSRTRVDEVSPEGLWTVETHQFEVTIQRGAAPHYIRLVKIQLPYEPHVPKKVDPDKTGRRDYDWTVTDAARLPLASDAALISYPPLIVLQGDRTGRMIVEATNYDLMPRQVDVKVEGPIRGSEGVGVIAGEQGFDRMDLKPGQGNGWEAEGALLISRIEARSGRDRRAGSIAFVPVEEGKVTAYEFDFDRDGAAEWVLEDDRLRVVTAPQSGGRIFALVDRESGVSLTNSLGLLRDEVEMRPAGGAATPGCAISDAVCAARQLFRLPYTAEWLQEEKGPAVRLSHVSADGFRVEKTARITGPQKLEVDYNLQAPGHSNEPLEWSFTSAASAPIVFHGRHTTRFCWGPAPPPAADVSAEQPPGGDPGKPAGELQCETFVPGKTLDVPEDARVLEVRTPGSFALRFEWPAGRMRVEIQRFSAMLKLRFPPVAPGAQSSYKLTYAAVVVE